MTFPNRTFRFLVVNPELPHFDRTSGGLRLFTFIELLREAGASCDYLVSTPQAERQRIGETDYQRYRERLASVGVRLLETSVGAALRANNYDVVLFEFFHVAQPFLKLVRIQQPRARIVVDSVDLSFLRWHAKADLSGRREDRTHAEAIEAAELETYRSADLVLTLTDDEAQELARRIPGLPTFNLPNIHSLNHRSVGEHPLPSLLFIGSFTHEPNVDAVRWFGQEIWPLIRARHPTARWVIIGANAPPDIAGMTDEGIEFKGRVPDTSPYLDEAWISIAPLRFGAGMKGKVGEALAWGLPVVTTEFGAQGYGVQDRVSVVLGDSAEAFAEGVIWLLDDTARRSQIGLAGQNAIRERFSRQAVAHAIPELLKKIDALPVRRREAWRHLQRARLALQAFWEKHLAWRI
ncbi:MAG: glycosyltransferase [Rhodocyclaceae bacterium]|jgi:glycosyltransferase involved in cell wall biosynthesis|nr:glycosyltransferase [Rhodocyclaceae bacterium]